MKPGGVRPGPALERLSPWLTLFLFAFLLRVWRINDWLLPNVDEIVLMNTMQLKFLEGCSTSSAYWPAHLVLKALFFLPTFDQYRLVSAVLGSCFVLIAFGLVRRFVAAQWAWVSSVVLSIQWYFLYIHRIIEIASFVPICLAACLHFLLRWHETGQRRWLFAFVALGGLAANIWVPPLFYLIGGGGVVLVVAAVRRQLSWTVLIACGVLLAVALAPYLVMLARDAHIRADIAMRYDMAGVSRQTWLPPNLASPAVGIKTWTYLTTSFSDHLPWKLLAPFSLFVAAAPLAGGRFLWRDGRLRLLLILATAHVLLVLVSPVPVYIEGHAAPLLLILWVLVTAMAWHPHAPPVSRWWGRCCLAGLLAGSLCFAPYYLASQQTVLADWLRDHALDQAALPVSDGARLKLERIPAIRKLELPLLPFACVEGDPFWAQHSPAEFRYVMSTYECDMYRNVEAKGFRLNRILTMNNLYEANLRHGIDLWEIGARP